MRKKYQVFLLSFLLLLTLCACSVKAEDKTVELSMNSLLDNKDVQFSFSEGCTDIGSYELVKQYEAAGKDWFSETEDLYDYAWSQCLNVWNSYITLYEASKDIIWLEKLSKQIDIVLDKRDNIVQSVDISGLSLPSWSYTSNPELYSAYHDPVMIGLIIHPILRFVEVVRKNDISQFDKTADLYLQASLDALSVLDKEVNDYNSGIIPDDACYDLWRERIIDSYDCGYYIGHLYYDEDYFKERGYISCNPLPYNQSLAISQCFPVLYRITKNQVWKEKTQKAWNWFRLTGINWMAEPCWWYYSEYYNWCRTNAIPSEKAFFSDDEDNNYEDYEGHYSIDLMFIIEAHKIGVVDDDSLYKISENKKYMGLNDGGWPLKMNEKQEGSYNLKAAVYFDYFVNTCHDTEYIEKIYPVLSRELRKQQNDDTFAKNSTGINGTCLRLLSSACMVDY